jgi:hypothetical protein
LVLLRHRSALKQLSARQRQQSVLPQRQRLVLPQQRLRRLLARQQLEHLWGLRLPGPG